MARNFNSASSEYKRISYHVFLAQEMIKISSRVSKECLLLLYQFKIIKKKNHISQEPSVLTFRASN